jgi:hypothetical protein
MNFLAICDTLVNVIKKDIFPANSRFRVWDNVSRLSCECIICWKLNTDKENPNKRSRTISIVLPYSLLEDYEEGLSNEEKEKFSINFKVFIENKYKCFKADHDSPRYASPPIEEWIVQYSITNSK